MTDNDRDDLDIKISSPEKNIQAKGRVNTNETPQSHGASNARKHSQDISQTQTNTNSQAMTAPTHDGNKLSQTYQPNEKLNFTMTQKK